VKENKVKPSRMHVL